MDTSNSDLWWSTVRFGLAGLLLYGPLFWLFPAGIFRASRRAVIMGTSLFWFGFTMILVNWAWNFYYQYFYPEWMRWGTAFIACGIYCIYAFGCHWLACRLPGKPILWFILFTGLLAANEHFIAWDFFHLPEKIPMLAGMPLIPTMIFAFFEYQVYWAGAIWLAWILLRITRWRKKSR